MRYGNPKPPPVQWKYHILPYTKKTDWFEFFQECTHLTAVGVTNDQVAVALHEALQIGENGPVLKKLQTLDVYYASETLFDHIPQQEKPTNIPDAISGNPKRDRKTLTEEQTESRKTICGLKHLDKSRQIEVNLYNYQVFPMAGIVAGDVGKDHGVIQVTHYIWGRMAGSCPTMLLRRNPLREVYEMYAEYLDYLKQNSTPWECLEEGTPGSR